MFNKSHETVCLVLSSVHSALLMASLNTKASLATELSASSGTKKLLTQKRAVQVSWLIFPWSPPYMGNIGPFLPQYLVRIPSTFVSFAIDNKLISLQSEVKTAYPGFLRLPLHKKFQLRVPNYFLRAIFPFWTIWNANKTWNDADRSKETKCRHDDVKMP